MLAEAQRVLSQRQQSAQMIPETPAPAVSPAQKEMPLAIGDTVWIPMLKASGQIVELAEEEGEADLQLGNFRMRLPLERLERRDVADAVPVGITKPKTLPTPQAAPSAPAVGMELDIRGATVEEMLTRLDTDLDDAYLGSLPWVRIIHGKGTGVLRTAVRKELSKHPLVKSFREGDPGEGGDGVTVAYLAGQ